MLTIYSRKNCSQCQLAKQWLNNHHILFKEIDVDSDNKIVLELLQKGLRQLPVITNGQTTITGFDAQQIQKLINEDK